MVVVVVVVAMVLLSLSLCCCLVVLAVVIICCRCCLAPSHTLIFSPFPIQHQTLLLPLAFLASLVPLIFFSTALEPSYYTKHWWLVWLPAATFGMVVLWWYVEHMVKSGTDQLAQLKKMTYSFKKA